MNPTSAIAVLLTAFCLPGNGSSDPQNPAAPLTSGGMTLLPVSPDRVLSTVAFALFGRQPIADDAALELAPEHSLRSGAAMSGWSTAQEAFDFIPIELTPVPYVIFSEHPPSNDFGILTNPATEITLSMGVLTSALGATVAYGAVLTYPDIQGHLKRFFSTLSALSAQDSATTAIPKARSDVWRYFDGSSHLPELVTPLLHALTNDLDAGVRDEASETLGNYSDNPAVVAALRYAAENDASPQVRHKATRTLSELGLLPNDH